MAWGRACVGRGLPGPEAGRGRLNGEVLNRYSATPGLHERSCPVDVAAVGYVYHSHHMGLVVDPVDDPVGAPARAEPVVHRRKKPFPDLAGVFQEGAGDAFVGGRRDGFLAGLPPWVGAIIVVGLAGTALPTVGRHVLGWRQAAGERRQQLKWLAFGAAVSLAWLLGMLFLNLPVVGVAAMPLCMGIAILKYRLYDIDRIISRTLSYVIVTGLLIGVYAGLVLLTTQETPHPHASGRGRLDTGGSGAV
jgi:hypothetical protein